MDRVMAFLENQVMPRAARVAEQTHMAAIQQAFVVIMPYLIISSFFLVIANLPIPGYNDFMSGIFGSGWKACLDYPVAAIFGLMSLHLSGMLGLKLAQRYKLDVGAVTVLSTVCFLIVTPFNIKVAEKTYACIPTDWLGAKGLFVAMIMAIISTEIFRKITEKGIIIKMPSGVPTGVARSFASLIPATATIIVAVVIREVFALTSFDSIHKFIYTLVAMPLGVIGNSFFGALANVFVVTLLWSVGLHGGVIVSGVLHPIYLPLMEQNLAAFKAGLPLPNVVTEQFFTMLWVGGAGATIALVLTMFFRARSEQYKELSKLALPSAFFNINEPILFGLPIVLNPVMLIPFVLTPMVLCVINYSAMYFDIVARPMGVIIPWTTPPIIQGWLITGSWTGAVLQLVDIMIAMAIYYPFFKLLDKRQIFDEQQ